MVFAMGTASTKDNKDYFHAYVTVRLSDATRKDLGQLAKDDKRTISNYIRVVLENHVETSKVARQQAESEPQVAVA